MKAATQPAWATLTSATVPAPAVQAVPTIMKAISHDKYGPIDSLALRDAATPVPKDDEVLVRVVAAGLHVGDCFMVRGAPFPVRAATGLFKPKLGIPGGDFAGRIEAVGSKVTRFKVGDEVFGGTMNGTCAEYTRVPEDQLSLKPADLSFEQAAAIPTSALAALHALRDTAKLQPGQHVLINGASGGVGTFAAQIAKALGAKVTGVCSTRNVELVRSLGADHVIDYTDEDFTRGGKRYDLILDNVENHPLSQIRRALTPRGMLILNSGTGARGVRMFVRLIKPLLVSPFVGHKLRRYFSMPKHADLTFVAELFEAGKLSPVMDKTYPLAETPEALRYLDTGRARGKVVVIIAQAPNANASR